MKKYVRINKYKERRNQVDQFIEHVSKRQNKSVLNEF